MKSQPIQFLKNGLYLVGYGVTGRSDGCTKYAWDVLMSADEVIFRWDRDPITRELQTLRKNVRSVAEAYSKHGPFLPAFDEMAEHVKVSISRGLTVAFATPGHPLYSEATSLILYQYCLESRIHVEVVPGISFVDLVTAALGIDLTEGVQVVAGAEVCQKQFRDSISPGLHLMICSVRPDARSKSEKSELDYLLEFLSAMYGPTTKVQVISALPSAKGPIRADVLETTIGAIANFKNDILRRCRVIYFVNKERN